MKPLHLFDLDGTLLDSNGIWRKIDEDFLAKRGLHWSEDYNAGVVHAIFPTAAKFTKTFCHLPESEEEIMAEWMAMAYEAYSARLRLKAGVRSYLTLLQREGFPMSIYTACEPELCLAALEHHGLTGLFQQIIYASQLGMEKRSPEAFGEVLRRLKMQATDCVFYDDSPLSCKGAKESGLTVVGVYDPLFADYADEMSRLCHQYITGFDTLTKPIAPATFA